MRTSAARPRDRQRPACRRRAGGFTLVELVAVIVILSVLAVTAVPALSSTSSAARRGGGTQIARDVQYARELALCTGQRTWVAFRVDGLGYSLLADDPAAPGRAGAILLTDPATRGGFQVTLGAGNFVGVRIGSLVVPGGGTDVGFDSLGRPVDATGAGLTQPATLVVESGPTIAVGAHTGLVTIQME